MLRIQEDVKNFSSEIPAYILSDIQQPDHNLHFQFPNHLYESSLGESNSSRYEIKPICVAPQQVNAEMMIDKCPTLTSANGTSGSNKPYIVLPKSEAVVYGLTSVKQ